GARIGPRLEEPVDPASLRLTPLAFAPGESAQQLQQRVVAAVDDALFHRNDRVVGDVDARGAHLTTTLGDVAETDASLIRRQVKPIERVQGVHLEARDPNQETRSEVARLQPMVPQDVADVLTEEALDAFPEL